LRVVSRVEDVIRLIVGPQQRLNALPQLQIGHALAVQYGVASGGLGLIQRGQKDLFDTADIGGHDELLSKVFTINKRLLGPICLTNRQFFPERQGWLRL